MPAAQEVALLIQAAQASRQDLLADQAGAHGVVRLWVRKRRMDLSLLVIFVQTTRKLRRSCMISWLMEQGRSSRCSRMSRKSPAKEMRRDGAGGGGRGGVADAHIAGDEGLLLQPRQRS